MVKRRVVLTTFAGRQRYMSVLLRYVRHLIAKGLVHEFHAWNFSRNPLDEQWLRAEFKNGIDSRLVSTTGYRYMCVKDHKLREGDGVNLQFMTTSDAHIMLHDVHSGRSVCEIVLGGWNNSGSAIRLCKQGTNVSSAPAAIKLNQWNDIRLEHDQVANSLRLYLNGALVEPLTVRLPSQALDVCVSAWTGTKCSWKIPLELNDKKERLFEVSDKASWREYYSYYSSPKFAGNKDYIIVKCDDDITFIDDSGFARLIATLENDEMMSDIYLMVFPNIINNGICAYHQQRQGLLPLEKFGTLPYDKFEGRLWNDGKLCHKIHEYFCQNLDDFVDQCASLDTIKVPVGDMLSINCFGIRSEDLQDVFGACGWDDELDLTVTIPKKLGKANLICQHDVVSHLAFYRQRETGLDDRRLLKLYEDIADKHMSA
jgi:hypothetical protein